MRIINRIQWYGVLFGLCCLMSCEVKRPDNVLQDAQMENVLYDYHIAKAMGEDVPYNESYKRIVYIESVFKKYGITQADFDSSMIWFARNPENLTKIYEKVNARLKAERDGINHLIAMRDNQPKESLPGDSIDLWAWQRIYQLTGMPLNNKVAFTLTADTNYHDRDTLCWSARFRFHNNGEHHNAYASFMSMQVLYEKNDTVVNVVRSISETGIQTLSLYADTLGKIKEIRGFIYYPAQTPLRALSVDRISLMRYHAKEPLSVASNDSLTSGNSKMQVSDSLYKDSIEQQPPEEIPAENPAVDTNENSGRKNLRPRPTMKEVERISR